MAEAECMNCGDSFYPEDSFSDHICNFCHLQESADRNELNEEDLKQCSVCCSEFYINELDHFSTCSDCASNSRL